MDMDSESVNVFTKLEMVASNTGTPSLRKQRLGQLLELIQHSSNMACACC
jgi:hypothetical protein